MHRTGRAAASGVFARSRSVMLAAFVGGITVAGCGAEAVQDADGNERGALDGLDVCGSPDGPIAAFWGSDEGAGFPDDSEGAPTGGDIWTVTVDGRVTAVTDDARSRDPSLSDDAQRLYFTRSDGGLDGGVASPGTELWVLDLATGEQSLIFDTGEDTQGIVDIEESPDGSTLAFTAHVGDPETARPRAYVLDLERLGEPTELPLPPVDEKYRWQSQASPTWGPDGSLAYVFEESDNSTGIKSSVRVVNLETGEDTFLYQAPDERSYVLGLRWVPDGSALIAVAQGDESQEGYDAISIDAETGQRSVLVSTVPDRVTDASRDSSAISSIGLTFEQINNPQLPQQPVITTWIAGEATTQEIPVQLSFATQLTVADCSHRG